jgi:hypothetical protein
MAKRKAQTSAKPGSGTKTRSKMKRAKPVREHNTRARSKQDAVLALLSRPQGATIAAIDEMGERVYLVIDGHISASRRTAP